MPATFHPDLLRASLAPLAARHPLSSQGLDYQRFYGLDLPVRQSWLGGFKAAGFELVGQVWLPQRPVATLFLLHGYYDHMGLYCHVIEWALGQGSRSSVATSQAMGCRVANGPASLISPSTSRCSMLCSNRPVCSTCHAHGICAGRALAGDRGGSRAAPRRAEPGRWPSDPAGAFGAATLVVLVETQLLRAAPLRQRHRAALQREQQRSGVPAVHGGRPTATAAVADGLGRGPGGLGQAYRGRAAQRAATGDRAGEADATVDWPYNLKVLKAKFAEPQILMLPEARHHLANELPAIRQRYFAFIDQRLG